MRQKPREYKEFSLTKVMSRMKAMAKDMNEMIDIQPRVSLVNCDTIIEETSVFYAKYMIPVQ